MVEQDYDNGLIASIPQLPAIRCVNCGNREDSLIRMNRALGSFARSIRNEQAFNEVQNPVIGQSR